MKDKTVLVLRGVLVAGLTLLSALAVARPTNDPEIFVETHGTTVSVTANNVPIRDVLEEIAVRTGIVIHSQVSLKEHATYAIHDQSIPKAILRILKDHNFTLRHVSAADPAVFDSRLWIFGDQSATGDGWSAGNRTTEYAGNRLAVVSELATSDAQPQTLSVLYDALNDTRVSVREEAVYGLSELDDPAAIVYLSNTLHDPSRRVRIATIGALADTGKAAAVVALSDLLDDDDAAIREEVIHAMADVGGDVAQQYLRQALADSNALNREIATDYLAELTGNNL